MRSLGRLFLALLALLGLLVVVAALSGLIILRNGISARATPSALESAAARRLRLLAIPRDARDTTNPVPVTDDVLREGREHFADHCATCHANDGSGNTEIGRNTYPNSPDMRKQDTQGMTDGEIFYIIENGVRFTAMPGWGTGTAEGMRDSWKLVHFVRHLPKMTQGEIEEMEQLNPKTPEEWEKAQEEKEFLEGKEPSEGRERPAAPKPPPHKH